MGFMEGHIEEEGEFHGRVFPKTLVPSEAGQNSCSELVELVEQERVRLSELLGAHGALLFRGFAVGSAEEFSSVVEAFGWDEYVFDGANRTKVAERVYTASAAPLHVDIPFHHEMAMIKDFPRKIFLYCLQPAPEGGQTSIIRSDVIVEKLEEKVPQVVEKLERCGLKTTLRARRESWQRMLKTDNEVEAEKRALGTLGCNSVQFNADGGADFIYGPIHPIKEFNGNKVLFNAILGYENVERSTYITFADDGSPLPSDATEAVDRIIDENNVDINWQKGDVLLVDNLGVQHARRPGKPPRTVLVSLTH